MGSFSPFLLTISSDCAIINKSGLFVLPETERNRLIMKSFAKILTLVLSVLLLTACFTGCQPKEEEKNVLKVATNAEFPPFESLENGEYVGFDVELIQLIAEKLEMTVEFSNMEFEAVLGAITSGTCDVGISGLTINEKRRLSVDFSDPYYTSYQIVLAAASNGAFTATNKEEMDLQLVGKKIGVCSGYTGVAYVEGDEEAGYPGIADADVRIYDNLSLAILDLKNGNIDAIVMDDVPARAAAATQENKDAVKVFNIPLTTEEYGIALRKGNTVLAEKVNKALKELKDEGKIDELLERWISVVE